MDEQSLDSRVEALYDRICGAIKPGLDEGLQSEIAALTGVLGDIQRLQCTALIGEAKVATQALVCDPPNIKLAADVRARLAKRVSRIGFLFRMLRSGSAPARVLLGLGTLLYFGIPLSFALGLALSRQQEILGLDTNMLGLVAIAGALGSIVSIMVRIGDFSGLKGQDPAVLFFTGFFKPVIGASFALFVWAALKSGLIPVTVQEGGGVFFFAAFSFVAGFSERFARDVITKTEAVVAGGNDHASKKGAGTGSTI